ncbi:hypothetical protein CDL15_Pgr001708 [Punica granatum]|uniref:Uncharacterized protein n=1 Tax=Punica granatum TaxID=22663 RepID=A0A218XB25_PUNGR|nr:hypothetical protein CDL15_Pgr001708 [Punica granatum]
MRAGMDAGDGSGHRLSCAVSDLDFTRVETAGIEGKIALDAGDGSGHRLSCAVSDLDFTRVETAGIEGKIAFSGEGFRNQSIL